MSAQRGRRAFAAGVLAAVLASVGGAGCRTQQIPSSPLEDPLPLELSGDWFHAPSGIGFPAAAAGFQRVDPKQYDREGNDVGIGYRRFWSDAELVYRVEVTVFAYPAHPVPFDVQFDDEVESVRRGKEEVREVRRVDSPARCRGEDVTVRAAEFTFLGGEGLGRHRYVTVLAAFRRGPWHVTYRATLPPARRDVCVRAVDELLAAMSLPAVGLPTGASPAQR